MVIPYDRCVKPKHLERPVVAGSFHLIGGNPDLGELRPLTPSRSGRPQECVDHHVFRGADGFWHLWGCIRNCRVGRILYHWQSDTLNRVDWERRGEIMRANRHAGESLDDWDDEEWIQSPFVVKHDQRYWMFYGGHKASPGRLTTFDTMRRSDCQICLMTSNDGLEWTRYRNEAGLSRVFVGPGETRDPCVITVGYQWYCYYAGYEFEGLTELPGVYLRTSADLILWSEPMLVHRDRHSEFGSSLWDTECPHVVERHGIFYLFRTENYALARTHVFWSTDPTDFGVGDARSRYLGLIPVAAPEIIVDEEGREYITSNHDLARGTMMAPLGWVPAS